MKEEKGASSTKKRTRSTCEKEGTISRGGLSKTRRVPIKHKKKRSHGAKGVPVGKRDGSVNATTANRNQKVERQSPGGEAF